MDRRDQPTRNIEVRRCTPEDAAALDAEENGTSVYAQGALARQSRGEVDFLVVLEDGLVCGSAELTFDDPPELKNLGVTPASRRRGLGSALVAGAEQIIERRFSNAPPGERVIVMGVGLDNLRAAALYERLGYVRTGVLSTTTYEYVDGAGVPRTATENDEELIKRW